MLQFNIKTAYNFFFNVTFLFWIGDFPSRRRSARRSMVKEQEMVDSKLVSGGRSLASCDIALEGRPPGNSLPTSRRGRHGEPTAPTLKSFGQSRYLKPRQAFNHQFRGNHPINREKSQEQDHQPNAHYHTNRGISRKRDLFFRYSVFGWNLLIASLVVSMKLYFTDNRYYKKLDMQVIYECMMLVWFIGGAASHIFLLMHRKQFEEMYWNILKLTLHRVDILSIKMYFIIGLGSLCCFIVSLYFPIFKLVHIKFTMFRLCAVLNTLAIDGHFILNSLCFFISMHLLGTHLSNTCLNLVQKILAKDNCCIENVKEIHSNDFTVNKNYLSHKLENGLIDVTGGSSKNPPKDPHLKIDSTYKSVSDEPNLLELSNIFDTIDRVMSCYQVTIAGTILYCLVSNVAMIISFSFSKTLYGFGVFLGSITRTALVLEAPEQIQVQIDSVLKTLRRHLLSNCSPAAKKKLRCLEHCLRHEPTFSVLGMFPLGRRILLNVASFILTYTLVTASFRTD